jgi:Abnormal spindle-like microcephaly-assoc'd, ASPM-SPD-2-Hydin
VIILSDAPNSSLSVPLSGTGVTEGAVGASPTSLNFGTVTVSGKQVMSETLTNTGGSAVTVSQVVASGTGFSVSGISSPATLSAGQSATFSVTFSPQSAATFSGNVTVTSNGSNPTLTIPLTGVGSTAIGQLTATPVTIAVGNVVAGTSGSSAGSLNASGVNVTVTAANSSNSLFVISGLSLPLTIPAGKSVPFTVTFSPLVAGAESATLTFTSNAQPSTTTDTATGTGTPAPTHSVNLSWKASTSPNISGYNVYRSVYKTSCGAYSKINGSALDPATTYIDSSVTDGTNYCYATTAVNASDEESGYSNIVSDVQIPPP